MKRHDLMQPLIFDENGVGKRKDKDVIRVLITLERLQELVANGSITQTEEWFNIQPRAIVEFDYGVGSGGSGKEQK